MTEWYYAKGDRQIGPVSFEELQELAKSGSLEPRDQVWAKPMKDWQTASTVPGIFPAEDAASANPYAAPNSSFIDSESSPSGDTLQEIPSGSDPLNVWICVKRGFQLTKRNYPTLVLVTLMYVVAYLTSYVFLHVRGLLHTFAFQVVMLIFIFGIKRICLNAVSGKFLHPGQIFTGGYQFLKIAAVYLPIFFVGDLCWHLPIPRAVSWIFLLLILGLALPYGFFAYAILDRNLGVMESLRYSAKITPYNRPNIFVLWMASIGVIVLGLMVFCFGFLFAYPVAIIANAVAYRWLQYGHRAVLDQPGTEIPLLANNP